MLLSGVLCARAAIAGDAPTNVVLILIDDLSHYGVTAYGAERLSELDGRFSDVPHETPRIDRLAADGLLCESAYVYPLCEASRVALMTGQYNSRNFLKPKALHASQITFGDLFQRAGYATGVFGKWKQSRGTPEVPAEEYLYEFGWDEFACFDVADQGMRYINPLLVVNGETHDYRKREGVDPHTGRRWYGPDICNRHALDFLDRHQGEPFFLYYPMLLVHDEHTPTPDTSPPDEFDAFPAVPCYRGNCEGDDRLYFPDMLAYTDKLVGRLVDKLEALGLREKTLIVVMGDNGTKEPFVHHLPDGRRYPGGKGDTKDNGLHVPLILSQPGTIPAGRAGDGPSAPRRYGGMVDVVDILPTLCEAVGIEVPRLLAVDGVSFWPQAAGAPGVHREAIYTWYNANNLATDPTITMRYAFDKRFKRYAPHEHFPGGRFFDLRTDLLEKAGDREVTVAWGHRRRSGLPLSDLDETQRKALDDLDALIETHAYVPVRGLEATCAESSVAVGGSLRLTCRVEPAGATRKGVVWESSDPKVATIDKFGRLTTHAPGTVRVSVYSWDDAFPIAAGSAPAYSRDGVSDSLTITVSE